MVLILRLVLLFLMAAVSGVFSWRYTKTQAESEKWRHKKLYDCSAVGICYEFFRYSRDWELCSADDRLQAMSYG